MSCGKKYIACQADFHTWDICWHIIIPSLEGIASGFASSFSSITGSDNYEPSVSSA
jgi:hypothetical protein